MKMVAVVVNIALDPLSEAWRPARAGKVNSASARASCAML